MTDLSGFVKGENKAQKKRVKVMQAALERLPQAKRELFDRLIVSWRAQRAGDPIACAESVLKYVQGQA